MSEQRLLNELKKLGWVEIAREENRAIFSFELGVKYCQIDFKHGSLAAYDKQVSIVWLTPEEMSIFSKLATVLIKKRNESKDES